MNNEYTENWKHKRNILYCHYGQTYFMDIPVTRASLSS